MKILTLRSFSVSQVIILCHKIYNFTLTISRWFHGKISGPEAVSKLRPMEDGLFLVRESIRHHGDYVLCVCFKQEVLHYHVIYQESKLTIDRTQYFYNLIDMVEVRILRCRASGNYSLIHIAGCSLASRK